jgi:hypothetical protein
MKITKKLKSKTVAYYVFPEGIRKETLDAALAVAKPGSWIREYTVICKDITVVKDSGIVSVAHGTYMHSKEIKNEKLPESSKS